MLPSGELLVINVTLMDAQKSFRCRTLHSLTQDVVQSSSVGRIQLTGTGIYTVMKSNFQLLILNKLYSLIEMKENVPPIMNEKIKYLTVRLEESIVIPCVAYANPRPIYRLVRLNNQGNYVIFSSFFAISYNKRANLKNFNT